MSADRDRASLQDMLEHGELAMSYIEGVDEKVYLTDRRLRLAIERLMEIVGEASTRVSPATRAMIDIDWAGLRGLRNVVSHQYEFVDHGRMLRYVRSFLPQTMAAIRTFLESP